MIKLHAGRDQSLPIEVVEQKERDSGSVYEEAYDLTGKVLHLSVLGDDGKQYIHVTQDSHEDAANGMSSIFIGIEDNIILKSVDAEVVRYEISVATPSSKAFGLIGEGLARIVKFYGDYSTFTTTT